MKTYSNFSFFLLLAFLLLFSACDKKETEDTSPQAGECQITKIAFFENGVSDGSALNVVYNSKGYVESLTETEGTPPVTVSSSTFIYNSENKIIRENYTADGGQIEGYRTYEYNTDGTLSKTENFRGGSKVSTETYTYDTAKRLTQVVQAAGGSSFKVTYQYIGNSENISTETSMIGNNQVFSTVTYSNYDDKKNILQAAKGLVQPGISKNNPGKEVAVYTGFPEEVTNYTYKYNASGFVTEMIEKIEGETDEYKTVYTYTGCK